MTKKFHLIRPLIRHVEHFSLDAKPQYLETLYSGLIKHDTVDKIWFDMLFFTACFNKTGGNELAELIEGLSKDCRYLMGNERVHLLLSLFRAPERADKVKLIVAESQK